jgi:hypothetical protein
MTYENGKQTYWVPDNPLDLAAFQSIPISNSVMLSVGAKLMGALRSSIVLFPTFPLVQLAHDTYRAYAESGVKNPNQLVKQILTGVINGDAFKGTHRDVERLKQYGVVGEVDFNLTDSTRGRAEKFGIGVTSENILEKWKRGPVYKTLHSMSYSADLAVRLGIYRQTLAETGDEQLAATRAREIINFRKSGTSELVMSLKRIIPFLGASIQGMDVLYRTATGRGNSMQERKLAFKAFVGNMATLSALSVAYAMLMSGDDEYEELKGHVTDYNFVIPGIGLLPVPPDIGFLTKVIPERITDYILSQGTDSPESSERLKEAILAGMARVAIPPHQPALITPLVELTANYSFFSGLPIVGREQQGLEPAEQYTDTTSDFAKTIGRVGNISPMQIDHLIRGIGGTTAGAMLAVMDSAFSDGVARDRIPGLSRFSIPSVGGRETEEFYALRELVDRTSATAKKYEEEGRLEDYEAYVSDAKVQRRLELANTVTQLEQVIAQARDAKQAIRMDETLTPEQRREQIDEVTRQVEEMLKEVNIRELRKLAEE